MMTNELEYNGWYSRETWLVNVHNFIPAELVLGEVREQLAAIMEDDPDLIRGLHEVTYNISEGLRDDFDSHAVNVCEALRNAGYSEEFALFVQDIFGQFSARVSWRELASHYVEEVRLELMKADDGEGE